MTRVSRKGAEYPATYVNVRDVMEFCDKLTDTERAAGRLRDREVYRLPSEAQWERQFDRRPVDSAFVGIDIERRLPLFLGDRRVRGLAAQGMVQSPKLRFVFVRCGEPGQRSNQEVTLFGHLLQGLLASAAARDMLLQGLMFLRSEGPSFQGPEQRGWGAVLPSRFGVRGIGRWGWH